MNKMVYLQTVKSIRDSLPPEKREAFDLQLAGREKNPVLALVLSLFVGMLGIDRFYTGNVVLGLLKLFTLGGFYIWTIIDWFLIMGAARKKNLEIASEMKMMMS